MNERQLTYTIPPYFNGSLKIMAVAVAANTLGSTSNTAEIRGNFIITPNVPTFVAPGDEFTISASIANNVKNSGTDAPVTITINTSSALELLEQHQLQVTISEDQEQTVRFKLRAKSLLGTATISLTAQLGDKSSSSDSSLSVRPASPLVTHSVSGTSQKTQQDLHLTSDYYPEYYQAETTLSTSPLILVFGLQRYLDNFPYGCTEQLVSKVFPLLAMNNHAWFAIDKKELDKKITNTIQAISQRQMANGSFSYWPGYSNNLQNSFISVYAMHFLTEAREQGFNVANDLFFNGINYLKELAGKNATDRNSARAQAYAIYVLTRNEIVTSNYIAHLQAYLEQQNPKTWQQDISAAYLAASYELLKSFNEADRLISQYQIKAQDTSSPALYDVNVANAQYLYLLAKHFPQKLETNGPQLLDTLLTAINNEMNTLLSSYTSLALSAYPEPTAAASLAITEVMTNQQQQQFPATQEGYQHLILSHEVAKIIIDNPKQATYFYQLSQSGFLNQLTQQPVKNGIEVMREYRNSKDEAVTAVSLGEEVEVHIQIRSLANDYIDNVVIEDLLPGGFAVVRESVKADAMDFADAREDRVNFFGSITTSATELIYKIKATNAGSYTIPPIYAEAMYNPQLNAQGSSGQIRVIH